MAWLTIKKTNMALSNRTMPSRKRLRPAEDGDGGGSAPPRFISTAEDDDEEQDDPIVLDDFDDDEDYDETNAVALLSSFRSGGRASGGGAGDPEEEEEEEDDEFDEDSEEGQQQLRDRIEQFVQTLSEKRRAAQAKGVEGRGKKARRYGRQRGAGGKFLAGAQKEEGQKAASSSSSSSSEGQGRPERQRDRKRKRAEQSRLLMENLRFSSKEEASRAFEEALAVVEPAYRTGKVKGLIQTNEELFKRMGLAHKIDDFGRSDLGPYRHRVNSLYMWHQLVTAGTKREDAYRLVGAAHQVHYNTIRCWVRGFHANGYKLSRLLSGLHQKTASFLDDEDIQRRAVEFIRLSMSQGLKTRAARRLVLAQQQERKNTAVLRAKAAAHAGAMAATDTQTTTQADCTQVEPGADGHFCVHRRPAAEEEEGSEMIGCDACEGWFHPTCVGLDPASREYRAIKRGDGYMCPPCLAKAVEESSPDRMEAAEAYEALNGRNPAPKSAATQEVDEMQLYEVFSGAVFHRWVNEVLLKDTIAAGAKPISQRAAYRWLHKLGFRWVPIKKGVYVDGHERPDVVRCVWM